MGPRDEGQVQIHDFNPGDLNPPGQPNHYPAGGVFWTRDVPAASITIHPGRGDARFHLHDLPMFDYFTVANALVRTGPDPLGASASVDIAWTGTGERTQVKNAEQGFAGNYENANASVEWSASNDAGYHFSTAGSTGVAVHHAFTATLRTGVFHP